MKTFLIIGQPRSGTTYLQTLLNSHPRIHCRGELFDPWQIDDDGHKTKDFEAVIARDAAPEAFLDAKLAGEGLDGAEGLHRIGAKLLFQHHPRILNAYIPRRRDLALIHVQRENKLAQFASLQQVARTQQWTSTEHNPPAPSIKAAPGWAAAECNRLENQDFLLSQWLESLPNPLISVTYRSLFADNFEQRILDFLGVAPEGRLRSPLHKQGGNRIIERFENADAIAHYFCKTGRSAWVEQEL